MQEGTWPAQRIGPSNTTRPPPTPTSAPQESRHAELTTFYREEASELRLLGLAIDVFAPKMSIWRGEAEAALIDAFAGRSVPPGHTPPRGWVAGKRARDRLATLGADFAYELIWW